MPDDTNVTYWFVDAADTCTWEAMLTNPVQTSTTEPQEVPDVIQDTSEPESPEETWICGNCANATTQVATIVALRSAHVQEWCEDCVTDESFVCSECSERFSNSECSYSSGDNELCNQCCDDYYFRCEGCSEVCHVDGRCSINADWYCESCSEDFYHCDSCDCPVHRNDTYSDDDGDYTWCYACYCARPARSILNYSHKPSPDFRGKGPRFFGVELEVESVSGDRDKQAESVTSWFGGEVYCKEDGSLDDGFEIVTHPWTLAYHRQKWEGFFAQSFARELRSYQTNTCGLHVHISRKAASKLTWGKFISFLSNDDPEHRRITEKIAMRSGSQWCKYFKKGIAEYDTHRGGSHYEAVNACNGATVEVRIFKGSLREESVLRALEFCDSLLSWVKDASILSLTYPAYFCWLRKRRKDYALLWAYLERRKLVAPASKPQQPNLIDLNENLEEEKYSCA